MSIISFNLTQKRKVQEQSTSTSNLSDPLQVRVSEAATKRISPLWQAPGNGDFSRFVTTTGLIQKAMDADQTTPDPAAKLMNNTSDKHSSLRTALLTAKTLYAAAKFQAVLDLLEQTPIPLKYQSARKLKSQFYEIKGDSLNKLGDFRSAITNYTNAENFEADPQRKAELLHKMAENCLENHDLKSVSRIINYALKNRDFGDTQKNRFFTLQEQLLVDEPALLLAGIIPPTQGSKQNQIGEENSFIPSATTSAIVAHLAKVHLQQGLLHIDYDQLDEAIASFQYGLKAIDLAINPEIYRELCFYLGTAYFKQKNFKDCIKTWQQCFTHTTDVQFKGNLIQLLASAYVENKEPEKATKILQAAIEHNLLSDEKGMLILCLSNIWLQDKGKELKNSHLLFPLLTENSTNSDEIKLQFCNRLMRHARETNSSELYEKVKLIGMNSAKAKIETKANFLIESAMTMEAQSNYSEAIEIYQFLIIQDISGEIVNEITAKIGRIYSTLNNRPLSPPTEGFYEGA